MKKFVIFILLVIACTGYSFAQKEDDSKKEQRMREVQEYRMKYLAQEMELTEVQKKKFFEVYSEMSGAKKQCYKNAMELERKVKHDKDATEQDYQQLTEALNNANTEWADTEKQYNDKFSEFLTQKQIYKMREAEANFRARFDEMKHNRKKDNHKKPDLK